MGDAEEMVRFMSKTADRSVRACVKSGRGKGGQAERACIRNYVKKYIEAVQVIEGVQLGK